MTPWQIPGAPSANYWRAKAALKIHSNADLCSKRDARGSFGAEEIAQRAGRDQQLVWVVIGTLHAGVGHNAVALYRLFTGVGHAETLVT